MFSSFPRRVLDSENVHYIVFSRETSYLLDASTFFSWGIAVWEDVIMFILSIRCYIGFIHFKIYILKMYCKQAYILLVG